MNLLSTQSDVEILVIPSEGKFSRLQLTWADGGYAGKLIDWTKQFYNWILEIVKRSDDIKGFQVLPRR